MSVNAFCKSENEENYIILSIGLLYEFLNAAKNFVSNKDLNVVFKLGEDNKPTYLRLLYYYMLISIIGHELGHIGHGHLRIDTCKNSTNEYNSSNNMHDPERNRLIQLEEFDADWFGVRINYSSIFYKADVTNSHELFVKTDLLFLSTYLSFQVLSNKGNRDFSAYFNNDIFYYDHPHPGIRMWYSAIFISSWLADYPNGIELINNGIHAIVAYDKQVLHKENPTNSFYNVGITERGALHIQELVNGWNASRELYQPYSYCDIPDLGTLDRPFYFLTSNGEQIPGRLFINLLGVGDKFSF